MKVKWLLVLVVVLPVSVLSAADWSYFGYSEAFYSAHSNLPSVSKSYPFGYAYPDNQSMQINHAQFEFKYRSDDWFGTIGFHSGRYVDENYSLESGFLRSIFSASLGKALSSTITVEGGVFGSHIGFESAIGPNEWCLSRSILADNSPYFESGLKVTYTPDDRLSVTALVLNGWQVISDPNSNKGLGTQIQWRPSDNLLLNSSTFIGNEQPSASSEKMRYFHDFFAVLTLSDQLRLATLLDTGIQENGTGGWDSWTGGALLSQWKISNQFRLGNRVEFFSDPNQVVASGVASTWAASVNLDWDVAPSVIWRNEVKQYWNLPQSDGVFTTALSISFDGKGSF